MLKSIYNDYKKQARNTAIGWFLTSIMVVVFISFTIIMVEYAIPSKDIKLIIVLSIIYFCVNILRTITTFFEDLNGESFVKELEADYREKIYFKIQDLKENELDQIKAGEVLENMLNDTKEIARFYNDGIIRSYCGGIVRLLGTIFVLMYLNVPIMIVVLFIYILGFVITNLFNKKSIEYTKLKRKINAKILNWSNDQVYGFSTIKTLLIEGQRARELSELINEYNDATNKLEKNIRTYTYLYEFIISLIIVFNVCYGSIAVVNGLISYGSLIVLVRYISSPETYAKWVIEGFQIRNLGKISYDKIIDLLNKKEEDIKIGEKIDVIEKIKFDNVDFSYDNRNNVLTKINIEANKGDKIALIGKTGCGKTSLVNLICRFYDLDSGKILINEKNYKNYSLESLRSKIGYIMQNVVIFNGTILENINYVNNNVSREEIINICKKLKLHDKIIDLENGYDTFITSDTDLLSTGEKQLLNFARVMVEKPEIIILDEATASLSYNSEMLIRNAIKEITKNKISFIIAHRLSTIKECSQILYLDKGKIIEQGNHKELIDKKGNYFQLLTKDSKVK
ncbi:MAG: ABC transporter ATP-binding protein [bacterium]|nr:ABC transporter ATP-binding protein [bacterium]